MGVCLLAAKFWRIRHRGNASPHPNSPSMSRFLTSCSLSIILSTLGIPTNLGVRVFNLAISSSLALRLQNSSIFLASLASNNGSSSIRTYCERLQGKQPNVNIDHWTARPRKLTAVLHSCRRRTRLAQSRTCHLLPSAMRAPRNSLPRASMLSFPPRCMYPKPRWARRPQSHPCQRCIPARLTTLWHLPPPACA